MDNETLAREILELLLTPEHIYDEDIVKVAAKIAQIRGVEREMYTTIANREE